VQRLLRQSTTDATQAQNISALLDVQAVRSTLLCLGLDMMADGIDAPWSTVRRFQQHVAAVCATPWPAACSHITSLLLPSLRKVLDSSSRSQVDLYNETKNKRTVLVGSHYVPVVLDFAKEMDLYDFSTQRMILDVLMITLFKHNVQTAELSALSCLQTLAEFAMKQGPVENRLIAIQILQTSMQRVQREPLNRVVPLVICSSAWRFLDIPQNYFWTDGGCNGGGVFL
jgi:hypothetical protein